MKTTALTIAAAVIGLTGFAYADEAKEAEKDTVVAEGPVLISDSEMEEIVAGTFIDGAVLTFGNGCVDANVNSNAEVGFLGLAPQAARLGCGIY